jgi:hypothetical protein
VVGRSLAPWESVAWARQLVHDGVGEQRSPQTVQRLWAHHTLQPWRHPRWLSPTVPREAACAAQVQALVPWYPRPLGVGDRGLCVDENTRLQPRTRHAPPLAAQPGQPGRVAHAYARQGALHLGAGCAPRPGQGDATTAARPRQAACLACWEPVERQMAPAITRRHVGLDHRRMHTGKHVQAWLTKHPRLVWVLPPVPGSWRHQGEPWFAIWPRQRLRMADGADQQPLAERLMACVAAWHAQAHPLQWSAKSVAQVMATCESPMAKAA